MEYTNKHHHSNMFFTQDEKKELLSRLPSLELSYEPKLHKKVHSNVYYIIPKGPKAIVWYTYWKDQHVCLLVKLNERGNYSDVQVFPSSFTDKLALGTIIYGTYFLHYNQHYFTCEQLHVYQGNEVHKKPYLEKLNLLLAMFQAEIEQISYVPSTLVVGMPVMTSTYEDAEAQLNALPYKTYGIGMPSTFHQRPKNHATPQPQSQHMQPPPQPQSQHMQPPPQPSMQPPPQPSMQPPPQPNNHKSFSNKSYTINNHNQHNLVFKVKAELGADKYMLYTNDNKMFEQALVSSYKSSVLLNSLFRNIKENTNLDLLEESDDEDEFENTELDRFVDLEKTVLMECVYSKRFKKWEPVKVALVGSSGKNVKVVASAKEVI